MKVSARRYLSCILSAAVVGTLIPQVAYAAPTNGDDGEGISSTLSRWFSDDSDTDGTGGPRTGGNPVLPSREKLPKGKAAPKPKRVGELTSRRTAHSRYWKLSDGRVQAEMSAVPTGYRSGSSWKDIDPTVRPSGTAGFPCANTTNAARTSFGSDAGRLLRFEAAGHVVTLGLQGGAGKLSPVAAGDTVTYKDAVAGADLSYRVGPGRVKENIVLDARPSGPVSFTFTLDAGGLTPKAKKDGSIAFFGEGADPVLVIPAAFMTDAKKNAASAYGTGYSPAVKQKLSKSGKGWKLTVTPDAKWLAAPERQYPVVIDPTISIAPTPSTAQDVMISSDGPGSNYDDNWRLSVGNTTTGASRALIRFPIAGVPAGTKLDSADLKLYFDQTHTASDSEVQLEAHRATQSWSESTATWNSANTYTGELAGTSVLVDNAEAGRTAAVGAWPASGNTAYTQYAVNQTYMYNKDSVAGDTYTWQPSLPEDGDYQVETHYVPASDRATNAPYTVTYNGGAKQYLVNQQAGAAGVWKTLGTHPFKAGTLGKIVLGDGPASTSTSVIADAVRFTKGGVVTKQAGELNTWHSFPVTKTVQQWIDGTYTNNGFVIKAGDESANGPKGGPRYEGSEFGYGGETANYPRLVLTFGRQGVDLAAPTTIHDTGAELNWSAYQDKDPIGTGDNIVEYQVHRSINQTFTPSAATLVSPVAPGATSFVDTSATPTKADDPDPFGRAYYYMVAVKTKDGQVVAAPTQLVRLPKAGRTTKVLDATQDTTLSSARTTSTHDTIDDGGPKNWLSVGNNSATYGDTRALLKFPALGIPATARVLDAKVRLWSTQTATDAAGAVYELRPLTRDFDESAATWVKSNATVNWTAPGGDFGAVAGDTGAKTNDPARHDWSITSLAQSWVTTPASQQGVVVKMADEAASQESTLFLSSEGAEQRLRPRIVVTYIDAGTESTYYVPQTPARMTPSTDYTVDFTLTNTTAATWTAANHVLSYRWSLPDGTDATNGGNQVQTALPRDIVPGDTVGLQAAVKTPIKSGNGNKRTDYVLTWDVYNKTTGTWVSGTAGTPGLAQNVAVEDPTSNLLGLEKFYAYTSKDTGAGSTLLTNLSAGNAVWQYNAFTNPGRGLTTSARFAYNSQDTSDTVLGHGWSAQFSGITRLGAPLDFRPNPNPTEVRLPDGDGTTHVFRKQGDGTWKAPAGVHFRLTAKPGLDCTPAKDPVPDAWTMTRPDGTRYLFGCDGYLTSVVDRNGNTQTFTYEERKSNNKPTKFLTYITDPAGRQSLTVEYFKKGDSSYRYIDGSQNVATGSNLTNSKIYDHVKSITDISGATGSTGRKVSFLYTQEGLLGRITDGDGSAQPKVFAFRYDATQGNRNAKLVEATDPRGNGTSLDYYYPSESEDPKDHWRAEVITDRLDGTTSFDYVPNTATPAFTDTSVKDAEGHTTLYTLDDFARPVRTTNAKSATTKVTWDADNNVSVLEEANGAKTAHCFDPKTGYPLWARDAEGNKAGLPAPSECAVGQKPANAVVYEYQTRLDGYASDLVRKTSAEGRAWKYGHDCFGNLKTVTDPKGAATWTTGQCAPTTSGYTTSYAYDTYGQLTTTTDANNNAMVNSDFDPNGYPGTITDPYQKATRFVHDDRGQVTSATDALGRTSTQTYDTFKRLLVKKVPKDQAAGDLITTPAPEYDANDNITKAVAPTGAVSSAVYDAADQVTQATAPDNNNTGRKSTYTYDKVGNLRTTTEPKGTATSDAGDYVTTTTYDTIYQPVSVVDANGGKISYEYDNVGNRLTLIDPKKNASADTADYTAKTEYDLNHRPVKSIDAIGKYSTTTYDKDSLVVAATDQESNKTETVYDQRAMVVEQKVPYEGATIRSTKYEYDQVGNQTKVITPRGVDTAGTEDFAHRTEFDKLNRPVKQFQPYDPADSEHNKADVYTETVYDEIGRVARTSLPPAGEAARIDTVYTYYDNGWIKDSTDPWSIKTSYEYDGLGRQEKRTLTGADGTSKRTMGWSYYPDGSMKTRTDASASAPADRAFAYDYDLNGNLDSIDETDHGTTTPDVYKLTYTGLNQVATVKEALAGQQPKTTSYAYDANGLLDTIGHPQQHSKFEYDLRDLVKQVTVGQTPTDPQPDVTQYAYTDRGLRSTVTKVNNRNTVDYTYYANGQVRTAKELKANGSTVSSHSYVYDANGNKSKDSAQLLGAAGDGLMTSETVYTYDPVDRIRRSDRTGSKPRTEQYWHDDNSNVTKQFFLQSSELTEFYYRKNRLSSSSNLVDSSSIYDYDTYGRMKSVTRDGGKVVEQNSFDGFDRLISTVREQGGKTTTTDYRYDALDRTVEKSVNDAWTEEYNYLGLSGEVLSEELDGTLSKSYAYGLGGERLSQMNHLNGDTDYYSYNSHGDVEAVTYYTGDPSSTYGYSAYGQDVRDQFTGTDALVEPGDEPTNPYRFNGKRWNAQSGTYDMGFRDYDPAKARFISRDMYNGAAADMSLGADPATASRYAFGAGNPVNNIELDGHESCDVGCQARSQYRMDGVQPIIPSPEKLEFNIDHHDGSTGLEGWIDLSDIAKELSGWADLEKCADRPAFGQCGLAMAAVFPFGKGAKAAKYLDEAAESIKPTYIWRAGREGVDDGIQGPIPEHLVATSGNDIEAGTYIFVQKTDGSVRAMNEELYESGYFHPEADWPGHTTLADDEPVMFAGGFTVDADGTVLQMTNGSGHYMPGSYDKFYRDNAGDYAPLEHVAGRALHGFGLKVTEHTEWDPWPMRNLP